MKKYTLLIWYRYVVNGEQEKDFDIFEIEALGVHDAFKRICKRDFPNNSRIPFSYAINIEPYQWYKASWLNSGSRIEDCDKPLSNEFFKQLN